MLDFAREALGIVLPVSDLVYRNAFAVLMQGVTSARVVGKSAIGGVKCDHLALSRPDVDLQVWVADTGQPLPRKYVVTDKGTPQRLSISTVLSDWNVAPGVTDARFSFAAPQGTKPIPFVRVDKTSNPSR